MKAISRKAANQLSAILKAEGIEKVEDHVKVQNSKTFMPLSIEAIGSWENTSKEPYPAGCEALEISLAHYGEQNGDLMADPEVCLLRIKAGGEYQYYPYYFLNNYVAKEDVYRTPTKTLIDPRGQAGLCVLVNQWVQNIIDQQYEGQPPKGQKRPQDAPKTIETPVVIDIDALHARRARLEEVRSAREASEREASRRRDAQVDAPTIIFTNARGIEKTEEARQKAHIAAQKKYRKAQKTELRERAKARSISPKISNQKGVIFTQTPAWVTRT